MTNYKITVIKNMKKKNEKIITKQESIFLVQRYYQMQEHRLAMGAQIRALKEDEGVKEPIIESYYERFYEIEKDIAKDIKKSLKEHPMWKWLEKVKGIGPILAASLLAVINIEKAQHASSVWKLAGLDVAPDGRGRGKYKDHLVPKVYTDAKGNKKETVGITFNPFLKTTCWKIGESFIKQKNSPYRQVYDEWKKRYQKRHPDFTKLHIHNMAKRKSVKRFLAEFWAEWRAEEGLEVSEPYAHKK